MKKLYIVTSFLLLAGCADLTSILNGSDGNSTVSSSAKSKMNACMVSEASARLQAGTLFTDTIKNTAQDISMTCAKKLALERLGLSAETQAEATNIINSLRNLSGS